MSDRGGEHRDRALNDRMLTVCARIPRPLLERAIVMGSAAIVLRGVHLGREPGDIDLFVSPATFSSWPAEGFSHVVKDGVARIVVDAEPIELLAAFPGVAFDAVEARAAAVDGSHGVRVAALEDLLTWKRAQKELRADPADRNKDAADIRALEAHLRSSFRIA
ncbi:hypothetical protein [Pendulispora albinea]|uniref:Polymerase nucleotidyl transferase domain-containing protein n=1 Tax=Pendulispora albinea TaxID=2741071 RepID=A0ABZ2M516_9BACT